MKCSIASGNVQKVETVHCGEYGYKDASPPCTAAYLLKELTVLLGNLRPGTRVLDVGCGNGYLASYFLSRHCRVVGIDSSAQGIELARLNHPDARFEVLPADEKILGNLDEEPFDVLVSTEVVEHLYAPREFAQGCFEALREGGIFICTTPYHGYLKNVLICLSNRFDKHFDPLWDGGHIKFWTLRTLSRLLVEAGFTNLRFRGAGRVRFLWKSMVIASEKVSPNGVPVR